MVAEIRKTTEKKKERNLAIAPMTSIPYWTRDDMECMA